jgi:hypothetical protein
VEVIYYPHPVLYHKGRGVFNYGLILRCPEGGLPAAASAQAGWVGKKIIEGRGGVDLKQIRLRGLFVVGQAEVLVSQRGGQAAAGRAFQKAELHEIRLVDIRDGIRLLADGGSDGVQAHRPAVELFDNGVQHLVVDFVQPDGVNLQLGEGGLSHFLSDSTLGHDLGVVPDTLEEPVGHAGCAPGAVGYFFESLIIRLNLEDACGAFYDFLQRCLVVEIKAVYGAEPVPEGRTEQGVASGGANHGKFGQVEPQALGTGAFADDDVQGVVFQGRIQYLLYRPVKAVDFIDEEDIVATQVGQDSS